MAGDPPGIQVHPVAVAPDGALLIAEENLGRIMPYDPLLQKMLDPYWIADPGLLLRAGLERRETCAGTVGGLVHPNEQSTPVGGFPPNLDDNQVFFDPDGS